MTIHLDTSVLVDALTGDRRSLPALEEAVTARHVLAVSTLVLYEWWRGPRTDEELAHQEQIVPGALARPFGDEEALTAARLYRGVRRARGRDMDLAIAACAIGHTARLWTLNPDDFQDIPGLDLYRPDPAPRVR